MTLHRVQELAALMRAVHVKLADIREQCPDLSVRCAHAQEDVNAAIAILRTVTAEDEDNIARSRGW